MQADGCAEIARRAHAKSLDVVDGQRLYVNEQLLKRAKTEPGTAALLAETDVLVDGPFILAERSLELEYRGSRNQR